MRIAKGYALTMKRENKTLGFTQKPIPIGRENEIAVLMISSIRKHTGGFCEDKSIWRLWKTKGGAKRYKKANILISTTDAEPIIVYYED